MSISPGVAKGSSAARWFEKVRSVPRLRPGWKGMKATWRFGETFWRLRFTVAARGESIVRVVVDGVAQTDPVVQLADDRIEHAVEVEMD